MSEQLKLTLTSQALEKLIGGNEPAAVEIRQGIAAEFARRYLKGIFEESIKSEIEKFKNEVRAVAIKAFNEMLSVTDWSRTTFNYLPSGSAVQLAISKVVKEELTNIIKGSVTEHLKEVKLEEIIDNRVKAIVTDQVNFEVKRIVRQKLEEAMNKV